MAFDPHFPPDHQLLNAAPFRDQFNGLNDLINGRVTPADLNQAIATGTAGPVDAVGVPSLTISDPPTQVEVQQILGFLYEVVTALKRQ